MVGRIGLPGNAVECAAATTVVGLWSLKFNHTCSALSLSSVSSCRCLILMSLIHDAHSAFRLSSSTVRADRASRACRSCWLKSPSVFSSLCSKLRFWSWNVQSRVYNCVCRPNTRVRVRVLCCLMMPGLSNLTLSIIYIIFFQLTNHQISLTATIV